jgi:hypothetical protein
MRPGRRDQLWADVSITGHERLSAAHSYLSRALLSGIARALIP